ncbi:hypothetical protein LKM00_26545 [Bacillus wiedmannii]|uniref:hypothetical protein n=1 Tax=Bacillus wiedmannii TaxID=1890302 RepID=UPI001E3178AC|nr:hypothetical protein [Bacillus wiedmannii]MCC2380960.1 hypothetical protein [Bacillus wiedmannii]MCC2425374.1 hypothetical protein [Bacillus wiedmannii]
MLKIIDTYDPKEIERRILEIANSYDPSLTCNIREDQGSWYFFIFQKEEGMKNTRYLFHFKESEKERGKIDSVLFKNGDDCRECIVTDTLEGTKEFVLTIEEDLTKIEQKIKRKFDSGFLTENEYSDLIREIKADKLKSLFK